MPYPVVFYMADLSTRKIFSYINQKKAPEEPYIFMPVPSNLDPVLAPPGKQFVIAGTGAPAGASNITKHAASETIGVGQTPDQVGKLRPR